MSFKLELIKFEEYIPRNVIKNNSSSGKVTVPSKLIGQKVYVVLVPKKK